MGCVCVCVYVMYTRLLWARCVGVCACTLRHITLFVTPCTVARQSPPSMGFSRQGHWSGLPFPPPGDLPHPETKSMSPSPALAGGVFTTVPSGKSKGLVVSAKQQETSGVGDTP